MKEAEIAIEKIEEATADLENLLSIDADDAWEKIQRWKDRAIRIVSEFVNETEGKKFAKNKVRWSNISTRVTIRDNVKQQRAFLKSLCDELRRYPEDFFGTTAREPVPGTLLDSTFEAAFRIIHPEVVRHCKEKFRDGYYADSAETAIKAVINRVKNYYRCQTGDELDGTDLMRKSLTPNNPIIKLGDLETDSGRNMQQGYMEIFAGTVSAVRNPKAHGFVDIDASRAIHFLFLASLQMAKLDEAKIP